MNGIGRNTVFQAKFGDLYQDLLIVTVLHTGQDVAHRIFIVRAMSLA